MTKTRVGIFGYTLAATSERGGNATTWAGGWYATRCRQ